MRSGLEVLLDEGCARLKGLKVGLVCNHTAVDRHLVHAIDRLLDAGVQLERLFGPEHGVRATAQDMIEVGTALDPVSGLPTISLYGNDEASLHPQPSDLEGLDVVLFDIQDIGTRFYTYQATLGFLMQVAGPMGIKVIVLDRPNPIGGLAVEGNLVHEGFASFVGAFPIAVRHGMTVGELAGYFQAHCGVQCDVEVIRCDGWRRGQWYEATGLPWVYPSPNMPTNDTATVYPGMCLVEATNWSEGRGTTRPFHLFGAPGVDPNRLTQVCLEQCAELGVRGVGFRPAAFEPGFQKHRGVGCTGVEIHVLDRQALHAYRLGLACITAAYQLSGHDHFWRTEPYEFVSDPPAIDLLTGSARYRKALESGGDLRGVLAADDEELAVFKARRAPLLLYPE